MAYIDKYTNRENTYESEMKHIYSNSYLVITAPNKESCVCQGIFSHVDNDKQYSGGNHIPSRKFSFFNRIAGSISDTNLIDCDFSTIGDDSIIVASVKWENAFYELFYLPGKEDLCCELNSDIKIGVKEKKLIDVFNNYVEGFPFHTKLEYNSRGFCGFLLMYLGYASDGYSNHYRGYIGSSEMLPLKSMKTFQEIITNEIELQEVALLDDLEIIPSSIRRIHFQFFHNRVRVEEPINWSSNYDLCRSDDGLYCRYSGTQKVSEKYFHSSRLLHFFHKLFLEKCKKSEVSVKIIEEDNWCTTYEFDGDLGWPTIEEDRIDEDFFNKNFKLEQW